MGHYLSDFEDRPNYTYHLYHALGYNTERDVLWHEPCRQVFMMGRNTEPVPEALVRHAEQCNERT